MDAAIEGFLARGYTRRADLDSAYTALGVSGVVLAFEIPGESVEARQPLILVQSQAVFIVDGNMGWVPATVIYGLVLRDSLAGDTHFLVVDRGPGSEPALVMQGLEGELEDLGAPYKFYYSMREFSRDPLNWAGQFFPSVSPQSAAWINGFLDAVSEEAMHGAMGGAIAGSSTGFQGGLTGFFCGTLVGATYGAISYVSQNPYSNSGPSNLRLPGQTPASAEGSVSRLPSGQSTWGRLKLRYGAGHK